MPELEKAKDAELVLDKFLAGIDNVRCFPQTLKVVAPTDFGKAGHAVEKLRDKLVVLLEGVTAYRAHGCWVGKDKRVVCEPNVVFESSHNCASPALAQQLAEAILEYGQETGQVQLAITNGSFFLADTDKLRDLMEAKRGVRYRLPEE